MADAPGYVCADSGKRIAVLKSKVMAVLARSRYVAARYTIPFLWRCDSCAADTAIAVVIGGSVGKRKRVSL